MKYRTRLYLWIGSLYLAVMIGTYVVEAVMTHRDFRRGSEEIKQLVIKSQEARREDTEGFLREILDYTKAQIETQSYELRAYRPLEQGLLSKGQQWISSATYLSTGIWLDLIQVGSNDNLRSLVILKDAPLEEVDVVRDRSGLFLATIGNKVYVAVPLSGEELVDEKGSDTPQVKNYALYDPVALQRYNVYRHPFSVFSLEVNPLEPFFHWVPYKVEVQDQSVFLQALRHAETVLKSNPMLKPTRVKPPMKGAFADLISLYEQRGLVWGLSTFTVSTPDLQPVAMARVLPGSSLALKRDEVFFTEPQLSFGKGNGFSVITAPKLGRFFFGKKLAGGELTIGINGNRIMQQLARAAEETSLFYADGKLICAYDEKGKAIDDGKWSSDLFSEIVGKKSGFLTVGEEEYYFLHLEPMKGTDMHCFLFQPKEKAFALLIGINKIAKTIIGQISWEMRAVFVASLILMFVLLHFLARKVTRRISLLAEATKKVAEGKMEEVHLPEEKEDKHDEVSQLYQSFKQMVKDLLEKEKVRAVLNKVVSAEIAEEILQGDVALGGEERVVTVLFADIRDFTHLTESMAPNEAVCLLNECMTRIARIIDAHGGVIDKFVGDEVMALFGAPIDKPGSTLQAVQCGIDILHDMRVWNEERKAKGFVEVAMGIGIHRGEMLAGNMGAENRLNYTVIGANVNLAFRLCSAAHPMELLVSQAVCDADGVKEKVEMASAADYQLKGFSEETHAYSVKI